MLLRPRCHDGAEDHVVLHHVIDVHAHHDLEDRLLRLRPQEAEAHLAMAMAFAVRVGRASRQGKALRSKTAMGSRSHGAVSRCARRCR